MKLRRPTFLTLLAGIGCVGVTLMALCLWLLLGTLGDEHGAAAARLVAMMSGAGVLVCQFLLINLLALGSLGVKMGHDA